MKNRSKKLIPEDIRQQAELIISSFNEKDLGGTDIRYIPRFKGRCLFLDRSSYGKKASPICRLEYTGKFVAWKFAIFRYSDMNYDSGAFMFPGAEVFDGTIESAMVAGLDTYAP